MYGAEHNTEKLAVGLKLYRVKGLKIYCTNYYKGNQLRVVRYIGMVPVKNMM